MLLPVVVGVAVCRMLIGADTSTLGPVPHFGSKPLRGSSAEPLPPPAAAWSATPCLRRWQIFAKGPGAPVDASAAAAAPPHTVRGVLSPPAVYNVLSPDRQLHGETTCPSQAGPGAQHIGKPRSGCSRHRSVSSVAHNRGVTIAEAQHDVPYDAFGPPDHARYQHQHWRPSWLPHWPAASSPRPAARQRQRGGGGKVPPLQPVAAAAPARSTGGRMCCYRSTADGRSCRKLALGASGYCQHHACPVGGCEMSKSSRAVCCPAHTDVEA